MKSLIFPLALLSAVAAVPAPQKSGTPDPFDLFIPPSFEFEITNLNGPGCPDLDADPSKDFVTRPTSGEHSVKDGYYVIDYFYFAYPQLKAEIHNEYGQMEAHSWCETTLRYREYKNNNTKEEGNTYALSMNVNGTKMLAAYDLDEGVEAKWEFLYKTTTEYVVQDSIVINGPVKTKTKWDLFGTKNDVVTIFGVNNGCGGAKEITFLTTLSLTTKKRGSRGKVSGQDPQEPNDPKSNFGVQQGISFNWGKCMPPEHSD